MSVLLSCLFPSSAVASEPSAKNAGSQKRASPYIILNLFDVWAMGVGTVLLGIVDGWNPGLAAGFGTYAIMQFIMMVAYVIFVCSLGEMIGLTLFSGGSYGIARVTMGFYAGFMIGAVELLEHILFTAGVVQFMGHHICDQLEIDDTMFFPIISFLYCLTLYLIIRAGHNTYWIILRTLVVLSVLLIVIFVLGSARYADFEEYSSAQVDADPHAPSNWFVGGVFVALGVFPYTTTPLSAIESTILITDMLSHPRRQISYGLALAIGTLCVLMIGVLFTAPALPFFIAYDDATEFSASQFLTDAGYSLIFGIENLRTTRWLLFPAQLALSVGLLLPTGKLYFALSESHLLPPFLSVHKDDPEEKSQSVASHASRSRSESSPKKSLLGRISFSSNSIAPTGKGSAFPDEAGWESNKNNDGNNNKAPDNIKESYLSMPAVTTSKEQERSVSLAVTVQEDELFEMNLNGQKRTIEKMIMTTEHQGGMVYSLVASFMLALVAEYTVFDLGFFAVSLACFIYLADLYSFIQLRTKYQSSSMAASTQQQVLKSPFGIPGAIIAGMIFTLCEMSLLFFQEGFDILGQLAFFWILLTLYYFLYAKSRQRFSRTEEKTLLALHVITNNRNSNKKRNKKGGNTQQQQEYKARLLAQKERERTQKKDTEMRQVPVKAPAAAGGGHDSPV